MTPPPPSGAFLLDTNLVVAATRRLPAVSPSLRLLAALAESADIDLVANAILLKEWRRNAGPSATAQSAQAVLVSNDRDFDALARSGLVEVWTVNRLLRRLGI